MSIVLNTGSVFVRLPQEQTAFLEWDYVLRAYSPPLRDIRQRGAGLSLVLLISTEASGPCTSLRKFRFSSIHIIAIIGSLETFVDAGLQA